MRPAIICSLLVYLSIICASGISCGALVLQDNPQATAAEGLLVSTAAIKNADDGRLKWGQDPGSVLRIPGPSSEATISAAAAAGIAGAISAAHVIPGQYIVSMVEGGSCASSSEDSDPGLAALRVTQTGRGASSRRVANSLLRGYVLNIPAEQQGTSHETELLQSLQSDPCVQSVEPNARVYATAGNVRVAAGETVEPGVQRIKAGTRSRVNRAANVGIAVFDSGIAYHPDLNVVLGVDCMTDGNECIEKGPYLDKFGHGTHVAGIIAAKNNGEGMVGVAPGSRLFAVKILADNGTGDTLQIIKGLDWVRKYNADQFDPTQKIRVINLSINARSSDRSNTRLLPASCQGGTAFHNAVCKFIRDTENGAVIVGSASNDATNLETVIPAAFPEVLTVTAMVAADAVGTTSTTRRKMKCGSKEYTDDTAAPFSNWAAKGSVAETHTVAAPGVCIRSTWLDETYTQLSGTSMAAPHVAGLVALCFGEGNVIRGTCAAKFTSSIGGGALNVIRMFVDETPYRLTQRNGFVGDADQCASQANGCKHYGYLVNGARMW